MYATVDELIFFTELSQRNLPFQNHGYTLAEFAREEDGDIAEHPTAFTDSSNIAAACHRAHVCCGG